MQIPNEIKVAFVAIHNRKRFYRGIAAAVIMSAIAAAIPYIYGRLVDIAIYHRSEVRIIIGLILLWIILSFLRDLFDRFSGRVAYETNVEVTNYLMIDIFKHLVDLPITFHKDKRMGGIMRRINQGVEELGENLIEGTVFNFTPAALSFLIALIILFFVEWHLSLILVAAAVIYILVTVSNAREIMKKQHVLNRSYEQAYGDLYDSVLNVDAVKSSTNENFENKKNIRNFASAGRIFRDFREIWLKMGFWQSMIFSLSFVAVFGVGVMMLRVGTLTPGKLVMFVGYTSLLTGPLSQLGNQYRRTKRALLNLRKAFGYYRMAPEKDYVFAKELSGMNGDVEFKDVSFGYKKDRQILRGISFRVGPGETVALVGRSGVGKSTLVNLVGRYYLPQKGKILIDSVDIRRIKIKFLREHMAIVPQEVLLFNGTIENNIRYGRIGASHAEIVAAAKAANAHEFIDGFPKKYEQIVGERGIKLSTGQKQRVAIARAILRNPKILILDEATSALDSASEKLVQGALKRLIQGRTTFIIAHRLSTIQHADKIIVLEKGKIAEMGKHEELMKNPNGIYENFWELQSAMAKIE